ncbi:MAG TPA: tetratricopeptide repeat protein [Streptosporangiaceae bacterium]
MAVLSREEFDAIEFDAVRSGNHARAAELMSRLAATATETAEMARAEAFLRAGEQYLMADDPASAAGGFRLAMADGGPVFVDPRVPLARALFQLARYAEAQALIRQLKSEGPTDPQVYDLVAELLVDRGDLEGALAWATAGVELCLRRVQAAAGQSPDGTAPGGAVPAAAIPAQRQGSDDQEELRLLLSLRYRIRNDLGLPEDRFDEMLDEA